MVALTSLRLANRGARVVSSQGSNLTSTAGCRIGSAAVARTHTAGDRTSTHRVQSHGSSTAGIRTPTHHKAAGIQTPPQRALSDLSAARRVRRKYHVTLLQRREYRKLKRVLPGARRAQQVSKVALVEEAIRYIDFLHQRVTERFFLQDGQFNPTQAHHVMAPIVRRLYPQQAPCPAGITLERPLAGPATNIPAVSATSSVGSEPVYCLAFPGDQSADLDQKPALSTVTGREPRNLSVLEPDNVSGREPANVSVRDTINATGRDPVSMPRQSSASGSASLVSTVIELPRPPSHMPPLVPVATRDDDVSRTGLVPVEQALEHQKLPNLVPAGSQGAARAVVPRTVTSRGCLRL